MSDEERTKEKRRVYLCSNCNGGCSSNSNTSSTTEEMKNLLTTYLGLSFSVFLGLLPKYSLTYVTSLQSRNRVLALRLFEAEEQLRQVRARRKEDGRANARAAEILAEHRSAWLETEHSLLNRLEDAQAVVSELRAQVESLERELLVARSTTAIVASGENAVARREKTEDGEEEREEEGEVSEEEVDEEERVLLYEEGDEEGLELDEMAAILYQQSLKMPLLSMDGHGLGTQNNAICHSTDSNWFGPSNSSAKPIPDFNPWQSLNYDSVDPMGDLKHVTTRESPWKTDLESSCVPSKMRVLEEELTNLENLGKGDISKIPSLMRKQAKRYQSLSVRIDDLCKRMRASDPYDPAIGAELRIQRQTEFLMEAKHLRHRATETRVKLNTVQSETLNISIFSFGEEFTPEAKLRTRRSLDSIRNNFKEIQRNLEVWLARILGDLEGMSRMREYSNMW
ncbi:Ribonuclease P protein subunit P38-like protein [Rhynchospora pubera]|uniref:Ribonuclease P protein subunit P38-like protein n=1 Tax=Rhynchospora pubera TaxID=906938 RepID=A0AAV8EX77_9POAL|nr:Ribonuclease P protein subunit P38-like protein [Rhynchospora pubera]